MDAFSYELFNNFRRRIERLFVVADVVIVQAACTFLTFHQLFYLHIESKKSALLKQRINNFS